MSLLTKFENKKVVQNTINLNNIKIYLFVEDIKEYVEIDYIKIDINEQSRGYYYFNNSIDIYCQLNKNVFTHALIALKYNQLAYEGEHSRNPETGRLEIYKKDIVSDAILYVSLNDNLIKIIEFKNLMILSYNEIEYNISLTCDHYIMFSDIQSIKNEQHLSSIYNKIIVNYSKSYEPYLNVMINNISDNYNEDNCCEDDWDDYNYINDNNNQNTFQKSLNIISNIFSKFY